MTEKTESNGRKETVTIREKLLSDGTSSLYLDIRHSGKRSREFLKLYLLQGNSRTIKEQNRQTMAQAEAIHSERLIEMQKGSYEVLQQFKTNTYFLPYYRKMCEERFRTDSQGNWATGVVVFAILKLIVTNQQPSVKSRLNGLKASRTFSKM